MAKDERKIERTKEALLVEFKDYRTIENQIEASRKKHRLEARQLKNYSADKLIVQNIMFTPDSTRQFNWVNNSLNLFKLKMDIDNQYSKEYTEFICDAYEINTYISSKFISDAGNYFKHPSDKNLAKIQPEFKRVMNIRNQKKVLKEKLFKSLCAEEAVYTGEKCKICSLNVPPAMYNLESQIKAYSEAVNSKGYNKNLEDKLLSKIMPSISKYSCPPSMMLSLEPTRRLEIFALGCGSGIHEYEFVSEIIKRKGIKEDFVDLYMTDINPSMFGEAVSNAEHRNFKRISEGKKRINVEGFQLDFTKDMRAPIETKYWSRYKLFLFLGSTLGNFNSAEQKLILSNICGAMNSSDNLIISVKGMHYKDGKPDKARIEQEYIASENFIYKPLEILGIERRCLGDYKAEFGSDNINEIVGSFTVIKDMAVSVGEEKYNLYKGDIIKLAHSKRFTKDELNGLAGSTLKPLEVLEKNGCIVGIYHKKGK